MGKYNVFVWDAPAHAASWPFQFDFDLFDKVKWLNGIFKQENITRPVIVGQSMGGYVGQAYGPAIWEYLFLSPSYTIMISYISFLPYSDTATPFVPDFNRDFQG